VTAASFFSGCDGFGEGFARAGFRVLYRNEVNPHAVATCRANHPAFVDDRDIRDVRAADVSRHIGESLDVMFGGSPCQPFSTAGPRSKKWNGVIERLSFEFVRLVRELRPRTFVMENVPGLAGGVSTGMFNEIRRAMRLADYRVEVRGLDAQWFGAAQERKRLIFVGVDASSALAPAFPEPRASRLGVRDVLPNALRLEGQDCYGGLIFRDAAALPMPTLLASHGAIKWRDLDGQLRDFTIDEMKALCGFEPGFVLKGPRGEQWRQLGNCVPPPFAFAIASALRNALLDARP
jgi:site-specific DNA-cytosine methylase